MGDHQGMTQSEQMAAIEAEARAHAIAQQAAAEGAEDLTGGETGEGGADGDAVVAVGDEDGGGTKSSDAPVPSAKEKAKKKKEAAAAAAAAAAARVKELEASQAEMAKQVETMKGLLDAMIQRGLDDGTLTEGGGVQGGGQAGGADGVTTAQTNPTAGNPQGMAGTGLWTGGGACCNRLTWPWSRSR